MSEQSNKAYFAAGCFWHVEETFSRVPGVIATTVGYMGGSVPEPSYEMVCSDRTGHAEAVEVEYDPRRLSYERLLEIFFNLHDPTTLNRQGPDIGTQYRSAIFYDSEAQRMAAQAAIEKLNQTGRYTRPIVTEVVPLKPFYRAEEYHQHYFAKG
jgi:peptide-methionine (S)-S-oxide reductase